ncbi:MAG: glycosyltransferase [Bacteroides sp.]|nr:glycosyltransferase [Bacteroides sp.]
MEAARTPSISIVMPVYNARTYLPFTMKNIVVDQFAAMQPEQWELIVVDDGSTDGSHLEIEPWVKRYPGSVSLLRVENRGVSTARNVGLAAARGEYVMFLDSDDILLRDSLGQLLGLTAEAKPDVIKFMFRQISPEEYSELSGNVPAARLTAADIELMSCKEYLAKTHGMSLPMIHTSTWQTIFRRRLLTDNGLGFDPALTSGEDEAMTWSAIPAVNTVAYTPAALLLYHQRRGSISHPTQRERIERYQFERIKFAGTMIELLNRVEHAGQIEPQMLADIRRNYQFGYYQAAITLIVMGFPMRTIYRAMKLYRSYGGDVHPGRPRFTPFYDSSQMNRRTKLRRFIASYLLTILTRLGL